MPLPQAVLTRQQDAIFRVLGEPANWEGVAGTVQVMRRQADQELHLQNATVIQTGISLRVRKSAVAAPAEGQQVQIVDTSGVAVSGALFVIAGAPELDRNGVWQCPARAAA